jgi:hypothetical protein
MDDLIKTMNILSGVEICNDNSETLLNYKEEYFDMNYCTLIQNKNTIDYDVIPKYLVLHLHDNGKLYLLNELKEQIMSSSLLCKLDDIQIYNISLKLLIELTFPRIINNKLFILLPPYLFDKSIFKIKNNRPITLQLVRRGDLSNILMKCSIILKNKILLDDCLRDSVIEREKMNNKYIIQQTQTMFICPNMKTDFFVNNLNLKGFVKGIFIHADIYQLMELKIFIDYQVYMHYDKHTIHGYCKRISSNLIFLPIAYLCDYATNSYESFTNAFNFNNTNSVTLTLRFLVPQEYIFLHILTKNELIELHNNNHRLAIYRDLELMSLTNVV